MDIVLGVSMTPSAVRMVLVEGENADGPSLDHDVFEISLTGASATSTAPRRVVEAILGTQESALEGGHRLTAVGVAWTDHESAATLRRLLRMHRLDDVVLVSELHAAGALAQAIGQTAGYERTALLFVERDTATLAVVRAADGTVVRVTSRDLRTLDVAAELQAMVVGLDTGPEPAQAVYVVGSGVDVAALESEIASATTLPVHAPQDGDLALARGAALASASMPRYEASTVGLASTADTDAGATQMAAAGYMAPLGYSAVSDDDEELPLFADLDGSRDAVPQPPADSGPPDRKLFVLVGSALSSFLVVGVAALVVTLAVVIRPTADSRPAPGGNPVVSNAPAAVPAQARDVAPPAAPETIQAPIPVVQEAPRTVVVAPAAPPAPAAAPEPPAAAPEPAPAPAAPPPAPEPAPAPPPAPSPPPPAPAPAPSPAAPAPPPPPVIIPVPIVIPPIFQPPVPRIPAPRIPSSTATYPSYPSSPAYTTPASPPPARTAPSPRTAYPTSTPPVTTYPQYPAYPTTTVAPSAGPSSSSSDGSSSGGSGGGESGGSKQSQNPSQSPLWPLWPFG